VTPVSLSIPFATETAPRRRHFAPAGARFLHDRQRTVLRCHGARRDTAVNSYYLQGNDVAGTRAVEIAVAMMNLLDRQAGAYPIVSSMWCSHLYVPAASSTRRLSSSATPTTTGRRLRSSTLSSLTRRTPVVVRPRWRRPGQPALARRSPGQLLGVLYGKTSTASRLNKDDPAGAAGAL